MSSRADILALIGDMIVQGVVRLTPEAMERAVALTLARYSQDRPREAVSDIVADGSNVLSFPAGWSADNVLLGIETPVDNVPPVILPSSVWMIRVTPQGEALVLARRISSGQDVRLRYHTLHLLTDTDSTIPTAHVEAFASYAAALLCEQIATTYADASEPTIQADSVDQTNPAREWSRRAREYRSRYFATLGIPSNNGQEAARPSPAGAVTTVSLDPSWLKNHGSKWLGRR